MLTPAMSYTCLACFAGFLLAMFTGVVGEVGVGKFQALAFLVVAVVDLLERLMSLKEHGPGAFFSAECGSSTRYVPIPLYVLALVATPIVWSN